MAMSTFLTALLVFLFFVLGIVFIGFYLMSKMVGGFSNMRALYRLFTGRGNPNVRQGASKSSSSGASSRAYNGKGKTNGGAAQKNGKIFGQNEGTYIEFEEMNG